ncbi:Uncharacterized protein conserved in bacteria [Propionibacterium australiense]|uniref:DUF2344 domain-containing protein n=1 Tax=Propionibacterium australiense TaxID=119981 RepID=A0A8B3FVY0_9ACTN|nr:DUF2344 domain-containing protein [Propionibacterium australiense]RLP13030.1 DUF2344 domain-containing protein [Propionibacterium australiense]VEH90991.1 Uncharacterized protein conserved in bacteria [Propionibacterium australiense]
MQRLRLSYSKLGVARFASHRDFSRAFERALRRAGVPMAYSSGFSPHPRISYANSAPTSAASYAEYADIAVLEKLDPGQLREDLNAALPDGFRVLRVVERHRPALSDLLQVSDWAIDLGDVARPDLESAVRALLAADRVEVSRITRKGERVFDARQAVLSAQVDDDGHVRVRVTHGTPLVRPDDVLAALRVLRPGLGGEHPGLFTRLRQGPLLSDGSVGDPLDVPDPSAAEDSSAPAGQQG